MHIDPTRSQHEIEASCRALAIRDNILKSNALTPIVNASSLTLSIPLEFHRINHGELNANGIASESITHHQTLNSVSYA